MSESPCLGAEHLSGASYEMCFCLDSIPTSGEVLARHKKEKSQKRVDDFVHGRILAQSHLKGRPIYMLAIMRVEEVTHSIKSFPPNCVAEIKMLPHKGEVLLFFS